ncbi:BTAD domain-containing putative transcriptional regulator [Micromonospora sp. NPDC047557]|uniref:BTAD domain-containing putative transcriptional regulator n=1 Tax=Micromonospora sp. NPDC047557 TaxID=3364250 RepID=UPI0037221E64
MNPGRASTLPGIPQPIRIGERLRHLRRRAGLTQDELAGKAQLSLGGLRDLEQHRVAHPRAATLRRLAAALDLSEQETAEIVRLGQEEPVVAPNLQIQLLGALTVWVDREPVELRSEPQRRILGVLAMSPNVPVALESMVDLIWGQRPPCTASDLVRSQISRLRRKLRSRRSASRAGDILVAVAGGYVLRVEHNQVDHLAFRGVIDQARRESAADRPEAAIVEYQRALGIWRGTPLEDLPELHSQPAVGALLREYERMILEYADVAAQVGRHEESLPALHDLIMLSPWHEPAYAKLMVGLAATGQQVAALQVYHDLRERLSDELGLDPAAELRQVHNVILAGEAGRHPQPARMPPQPAPAERDPIIGVPTQLPAEPQGFVGRVRNLNALDELVARTYDTPGALTLAVVSGTAGVGKTALTLHWAQRVRSEFSDGQLYANLGGFGPDSSPADPSTVLGGFLEALGVPSYRLPAGLAERAATFRSMLAGKRILVVLDNAQDADHVRPMLPGTPGCMVVVTSRNAMRGLVALEGAHFTSLDLLPRGEAHALLVRRLGERRVAAEPRAVDVLIGRCAGLPLALAIASARAATNPMLTLSALAAQMCAEGALSALHDGEPSTDLRRVFSWSYSKVGQTAARLFRLLGRRAEPEVDLSTAMELAGVPYDRTRQALAELALVNLITERAPQQYAMHSLLRSYAASLV